MSKSFGSPIPPVFLPSHGAFSAAPFPPPDVSRPFPFFLLLLSSIRIAKQLHRQERDREEVSGIPLSPSASGWGAGGGGHWQQCEQGLGSLYSPVTFGEVSRGYPSLILAVTHSMSTGNLVGASCQLLT